MGRRDFLPVVRKSTIIWAAQPSRISPFCPKSPWRKSARTRRSTRSVTFGCGVTTGVGAVVNTAKVEAGANCAVFGLGGIGLNVIQGLRLVGAGMIVGVDINPARKAWGERFGMTHFVDPNAVGGELVPYLVNMTKSGADQIGGADYTFDCTGNVAVMR